MGLVGCAARPATQLIIHVDTDLAQGTMLVGYHIRVRHDDDGTTVSDVDYSLLPGAAPRNVLPAELGVLARDRSDARRLDVDVTAELADPTNNFTVRAVVGFRADHAERLDLFLAQACTVTSVRAACESRGQTCGPEGACLDVTRTMLPDEPLDAATRLDATNDRARQAAHGNDGAADTAASDTLDADGGPALDAPVEAGFDAEASTRDVTDDARIDDVPSDSVGADVEPCVGGTVADCDSGLVCLATDADHCGTCGHACGAGFACTSGTCIARPPANDHCADATPIDLSQASQTIVSTNVNATADLAAPCTTSGVDVFYSFTLAQPELVYADTTGATWDTVLYFANSCTTAMPVSAAATGLIECDDDLGDAGCSVAPQSQVTAYLGAGTYYLVLAGGVGTTGTASLHFQHLPTGNNGVTTGLPPRPGLLPAGLSTQSGTTTGTGLITAASEGLTACYLSTGTSEGPGGACAEQTYFWRSCPEYAGGTFTATTCNVTTTFDSLIYVANAGSTTGNDCGDDNQNCASNFLSSILPHVTGGPVTIPSGAGLHVFVVDGYSATSAGAFQVSVVRP